MRAEIILALTIAADVYRKTAGVELVVTEITGGTHGTASLHYVGCAADLRTRDIPEDLLPDVVLELSENLGENYDVILETDHIHIEFQPK